MMRSQLPPLPDLALEPPTLTLTAGIYIAGRNYYTVAALVAILVDGVGRMGNADLERIIKLGDDAYLKLKENEGD